MKAYFELQFIMMNRKVKEAGLPPILAYLLGLIIFGLLAEYTFQRTEYAAYFIILGGLSIQFQLLDKDRTDFLTATFGDSTKNKILVLENIILSLPFVLILVYKTALIEACILLLSSIILALFYFRSTLNISIPTPFSNRPFEFSTGFRKTFFLLLLAYLLTIIAINVDNFNLGLFALPLIFLTSISYYSQPENTYYVWIYAATPNSFLIKKIMHATANASLLISPVLIALLAFYQTHYLLLVLFTLSGNLFLWTVILAKYAAFPKEINLPTGIILALALSLPPLLFVLIPYFYTKSVRNLRLILHDKN